MGLGARTDRVGSGIFDHASGDRHVADFVRIWYFGYTAIGD